LLASEVDAMDDFFCGGAEAEGCFDRDVHLLFFDCFAFVVK
jgi:hypothetical protein